MNILGVSRGKRFSPNMGEKDKAIMTAVAEVLCTHGDTVELIEEERFEEMSISDLSGYDAVFSMLRGEKARQKLKYLENNGVVTMNCSDAVENAERVNITKIMIDCGVPLPETVILNGMEKIFSDFPCWIKNGKGWASYRDDVSFVESIENVDEILLRLRTRYHDCPVLVSRHIKGDLIKFYGVEDTDFFCWCYPDTNNSKFGIEAINGEPKRFPFDALKLKECCEKVAKASEIIVYGGDCIVDNNGCFWIIDFNDWPSFSTCRQQAAQAIAKRLYLLIANSLNPKSAKLV